MMVLTKCVEWPHPVLLNVKSRRHQFRNGPRDMPRDLPSAVQPDTLIYGARDTVPQHFVLRLGFFEQNLIFLHVPNTLYHVRTAGLRLTKSCRRIHGYTVVYPHHSPLFPPKLGIQQLWDSSVPASCIFICLVS
jgi:hypothetical protein